MKCLMLWLLWHFTLTCFKDNHVVPVEHWTCMPMSQSLNLMKLILVKASINYVLSNRQTHKYSYLVSYNQWAKGMQVDATADWKFLRLGNSAVEWNRRGRPCFYYLNKNKKIEYNTVRLLLFDRLHISQ